jgi:hypothetical protein
MGNDWTREASWTENVNGHDTKIKEATSNKTNMNLLTGGATVVGSISSGYAASKFISGGNNQPSSGGGGNSDNFLKKK